MSTFSESIADRMLRNAIEVIERVERIIADQNHPAIYPFVESYLSDRPGVWVYAQEIVNASDDHFTLSGVGAVMGDLHDQGRVTTIGIAGQANRRAKWDTAQKLEAETPSWEKEDDDGRSNHEGDRRTGEAARRAGDGIPVGGRPGDSEVRGGDPIGAREVAARAGGIESTRLNLTADESVGGQS